MARTGRATSYAAATVSHATRPVPLGRTQHLHALIPRPCLSGKPSHKTLRYLSTSFFGAPGCGWDNLKRHAYLQSFVAHAQADARTAASLTSPCARRYRRVAEALRVRMNASACCAALGVDAPRGHFGHDMVPVW